MRWRRDARVLTLASLVACVSLCGTPGARAQSALPAKSAAATTATGIGPLRLGMSLDEVRAAAPRIEWRDVMVSPFTGRVFSMRSDDDIVIAGIGFQVEALAHYYEHRLRLDGVTHADDAAACERAGLDLLAAIEPQAGPFASHAPVTTPPSGGGLYWQTQRGANGSITVVPTPAPGSPARTDGETVPFGHGSTVLVEAFDDKYRPRARVQRFSGPPAFLRMQAHRYGEASDVRAEVNFGIDTRPACAIHLELRSWTQPPLPQAFDTSKARLLHEPTIAERHLVHGRLAGTTGAPVDVELGCEVSRQAGLLTRCGVVKPDNVSVEQEETAHSLARLLQFDMSGVDRDDPQGMRANVTVRVDPAARRPVDFLAAPRTPVADIEFAEQPDPDALRVISQALGKDDDAGVAVPLVCRIEADGSLICADPQGATDPERKAVAATATRVAATGYRAAPKLRNGEPSAGKVFDFTVNVQPAF